MMTHDEVKGYEDRTEVMKHIMASLSHVNLAEDMLILMECELSLIATLLFKRTEIEINCGKDKKEIRAIQQEVLKSARDLHIRMVNKGFDNLAVLIEDDFAGSKKVFINDA